jgi:hypothetical protein
LPSEKRLRFFRMIKRGSAEYKAYQINWKRRRRRLDPAYREKERAWMRKYTAKNRAAINFLIKCWHAGVHITMRQARELLKK